MEDGAVTTDAVDDVDVAADAGFFSSLSSGASVFTITDSALMVCV